MAQKIIIFDFGSQYTQLIARRVRELNTFSEIHPYNQALEYTDDIIGVILSGSPFSVNDPEAPQFDIMKWADKVPVLAICYGAQYLIKTMGGQVEKSQHREYGRAHLQIIDGKNELLKNITNNSVVWMSHGDSVISFPANIELLAKTNDIPVAAFKVKDKEIFALQFHPEVTHSEEGLQFYKNFVIGICKSKQDWNPEFFIEETIKEIKEKVGNEKVIMGLSGGVDSTVAAVLIHQAIGDQLYGIFVDNGVLRKNEFEEVLEVYKKMGLNVKGVAVGEAFLDELEGVSDPETKRKIIGRKFIETFDYESSLMTDAKWLGQGTIYPDVIESISVKGPSATIKSHHNVGGLPEKMNLKLIEPLRSLFKDEVRKVGRALGIDSLILDRHPFPGPGLSIRILGEITKEKVRITQEADFIFINELKASGWYDKVWQAGAIFLPVYSVGVMGDERTYENVICLRAVISHDGMTADWSHLPYELLGKVSNKIINNIKGINRVVYDISSKPPATIEWE